MEFKSTCDICHEGFSAEDLSDPQGVVRMNPIEGTESTIDGKEGRNWVIVGFGTGYGTAFVHARCLDPSKRIGSLRGFGDAN